jgi:DNA-binding response OmpR family regulator
MHVDAYRHNLVILLVDDEPKFQQAISRSLSRHGYQVMLASTKREAVDAIRRCPPDLLLVDINLPDATGWDVLRDLVTMGISIRTIVMSAASPSAERIHEFRPFGVLQKPFPIDALRRFVERAEAQLQSASARLGRG